MRIKTGVVLSTLLLTACAMRRPNLPPLPPDSGRLSIDGVTFAPPAGEGWYYGLRNPYHIGLIKPRSNQDETIVVEAQLFKIANPVGAKDFVQQIKTGEAADTDPARFTAKLHDVTAAKIGQTACARSHSIAEDHAPHVVSHSGKTMILEMLSLKCSAVGDPHVGISVTYSERYYPGDEDPQFMTDAGKLLDSVELTKLKE